MACFEVNVCFPFKTIDEMVAIDKKLEKVVGCPSSAAGTDLGGERELTWEFETEVEANRAAKALEDAGYEPYVEEFDEDDE